jgi:hypothetical protein
MDGTKFDAITQGLAEAPTRRRLLAGLLSGASVLTGALVLTDAADAKKGKGKAKGKGKGKKNNGNGGGNGKGKKHGHNKVAICHKIDDDTFEFMRVPAPALKRGHRKHGDTICGETEPGVCQTTEATGCNADGSCVFTTAADDTPCVIVDENEEEVAGTCQAGVCEPVTEEPEEPVA